MGFGCLTCMSRHPKASYIDPPERRIPLDNHEAVIIPTSEQLAGVLSDTPGEQASAKAANPVQPAVEERPRPARVRRRDHNHRRVPKHSESSQAELPKGTLDLKTLDRKLTRLSGKQSSMTKTASTGYKTESGPSRNDPRSLEQGSYTAASTHKSKYSGGETRDPSHSRY